MGEMEGARSPADAYAVVQDAEQPGQDRRLGVVFLPVFDSGQEGGLHHVLRRIRIHAQVLGQAQQLARRAVEHFRQALRLEQGSYQVWNNLADSLEQTGRRDEAIAAYRQTRLLAMQRLAVNPKDADVRLAVADASAALGEIDKAREALSDALRLAPTEAHTLFLIGVFYEARLNERDEALKWLDKAVGRGQMWGEIDRLPALRRLRQDPRFERLRHPR